MSVPSHEERFYRNVVDLTKLVYELITICSKHGATDIDPKLVDLAGMILSQINKVTIITNYIYYSHQHWDSMKERSRQYLMDNAKYIFRDLPMDKVDAFKILFTARDKNGQNIISRSDEEAIWKYFDSLVKISIKYVAFRRKTEPDFFKNIDLQYHASKWGVQLE